LQLEGYMKGMDLLDIKDYRKKIDELDDDILELFLKRMAVSDEIAGYKKEHNLAVINKGREREILSRISNNAGPDFARYARMMFSNIFEISRSHQRQCMDIDSPLSEMIRNAQKTSPAVFPDTSIIACQGVEGSYSQQACDRLFSFANIVFFKNFEGVFNAVEKGMCEFGMLPIDNSSYGSVTEVYDLMKDYNFHIVRSIKIKVDHALLMCPGGKMSDIREIYSHEQAIGQCSEFFKKHGDITVHTCENTAVAAQMIAELDRPDIAAISSRQCAGLYGLSIVADGFQNSEHNYTRFICISKNLIIYPGSNRISLILALPHEPGSLHAIISQFAVLGLNLTKLESRPILGRDFEFMFFFDFDASLNNKDVISLLDGLSTGSEMFNFLGNYSEV